MAHRADAGCFPQVEACYSWTWTDFHMSPHQHDRAEIMYLLRGRCCIQLADREVQLNVGEFIFIDAGVSHALQVDGSCYMVNVEFRLTGPARMLTLGMLAEHSPALARWLERPAPYQLGRDPDGAFYGVLSGVVDDYSHRDTVDGALSELRLGQMLVLMADALASSGVQSRCLVHVRRCVKLLSERMGDEVRVDDIAAEVGVSAAYLQRIFHQTQGMTIVEYLNRLRVERAKLLLASTRDPVIDVAVASGFNSRQHFTRIFTAQEGLSPQSYRQRCARSDEKQVYLFPSSGQDM